MINEDEEFPEDGDENYMPPSWQDEMQRLGNEIERAQRYLRESQEEMRMSEMPQQSGFAAQYHEMLKLATEVRDEVIMDEIALEIGQRFGVTITG